MNFKSFNLSPEVVEAISATGYEKPTPVQEMAIPLIMDGKDLIACAQTGTGKTAAYILPLLHLIASGGDEKRIRALIIVPTRELAQQVDQQFQGFGYFLPVSSAAVYGGGDPRDWEVQKKAMTSFSDVIIATPGRMISHINLGYVDLKNLDVLILDEADRMLDMGFFDDIMRIITHLPKKRQTLMFSATMPPKIRQLANKLLHKPESIDIAVSKPAEGVLQAAYMVEDNKKNDLISELLKGKHDETTIIFASTKGKVKQIARQLKSENLNVREIHSDLEQHERESVMLAFKNKKFNILVATDIISRGIDIENINLIVNYDAPQEPEDYIHRVGRTARAERTGVALTFVNRLDKRKFDRIEKFLKKEIHKIPVPKNI